MNKGLLWKNKRKLLNVRQIKFWYYSWAFCREQRWVITVLLLNNPGLMLEGVTSLLLRL